MEAESRVDLGMVGNVEQCQVAIELRCAYLAAYQSSQRAKHGAVGSSGPARLRLIGEDPILGTCRERRVEYLNNDETNHKS